MELCACKFNHEVIKAHKQGIPSLDNIIVLMMTTHEDVSSIYDNIK